MVTKTRWLAELGVKKLHSKKKKKGLEHLRYKYELEKNKVSRRIDGYWIGKIISNATTIDKECEDDVTKIKKYNVGLTIYI